MKISQLKIYSIGTVAANKPRNTTKIEVTPLEAVSQTNGELTDNMDTVTLKGKTDIGASFETQINTSASITAEWLPLGTPNRTTAPDVRRGEQVLIFEFADTNEYWWTTLKNTDKLRKLETVILAFSATTDEEAKATAENTYFIEISTHDKRIHLHTSKANGEPYSYDVLLDTAQGEFQLTDDIKNTIFLSSREKQLVLLNADGSFLDINKKIININAVDTINLNAGKGIYMSAPNVIEFETKHFNVLSPKSDFSGMVNISKNTFIAGGLGVGSQPGSNGTASIANNLVLTGHLSSTKGSTWEGTVKAGYFDGPGNQ